MNLVVINLGSDVPAIRANAIEAIDNMVSRKIGRLLIPLIESSDPASDERAIREVGGVTSLGRRERMQELLKSPDGWLSACVMREIMEDGPEDLFPEIGRLISSPNVLCRETVLYCMLSKRRVDIGLPEIEKLKFDRSPLVAAFACEVIRRGTPGAEGAK
jgi:hypothetical protein